MALNFQQLQARKQAGTLGPKQKARLQAMRQGELAKQQSGVGPTKKTVVQQAGNIKNPSTAVKAEMTAEDYNAVKNIGYNNPDTYTPFGSQTVTYDENGNPVVNQELSDNQTNILGKDEELSKVGRQLALGQLQGGGFNEGFNPTLTDRTGTGDLIADRQRIEDDVFSRLTRDFDQDYGNAKQNKEQQLHDRGIAFSADPNSRYQQELRGIDQRFDDAKLTARQTATEMGGNEYQRNFGIGEQQRANEFSEQQNIHNQQLGDINTLGNYGSGLLMPNFQQYQGYNYNPASPLEAYGTVKGIKQNQQQLNIAKQQASRPAYQPAAAPAAPAGPPIGSGPPPGL